MLFLVIPLICQNCFNGIVLSTADNLQPWQEQLHKLNVCWNNVYRSVSNPAVGVCKGIADFIRTFGNYAGNLI